MEYLILIGFVVVIFAYFKFKDVVLKNGETKLWQQDSDVAKRITELHDQIDTLKEDINKPSEPKTKEEILGFWNKGE